MNNSVNREYRLLWRLATAACICLLLQAAAGPEQRVGVTLDLRASQETLVTQLWIGSDEVIRNGLPIKLGRPGFEGAVIVLDPYGELPSLHATWMYSVISRADNTVEEERKPLRRDAQAVVALGNVFDATMLELLRKDTDRRWLKLILTFDGALLKVRGRIE